MANILMKQLKELKTLEVHHKAWMIFSMVIVLIIGLLVFDLNELRQAGLLWPISVFGILISVAWWYWSMRLIKILMRHRKEETEVLIDIFETIKDMKEDLRKNIP